MTGMIDVRRNAPNERSVSINWWYIVLSMLLMEVTSLSCPSCFQKSPVIREDMHVDLPCVRQRLHTRSHVFVSKKTTQSVLCVPQKNGNIFWSLLLHKVYDPKTSFELPKKVGQGFQKKMELSSQKENTWYNWLEGLSIPRVMIVRNPYIRLLSGFLDKIHHESGRKKFAKSFKFPAPLNFESFVVWLAMHLRGRERSGKPADYFVRHLFMPQTYHCLLPCGVNYTIVKDEKSLSWYPCLLDKLNLTDAARTGWGDPPCFLSQSGDCNTNAWPDTTCENRDNVTTSGKVHSKHTETLMQAHYTSTAAKLVTMLFREDIENFGYQAWDGKIENFVRD